MGSGRSGSGKPPPPGISSGRMQRGADLAKLSASTSAGYVASRVRGLRGRELADQRFHTETAERILELLGSMKGAAMKLGQIASFVDFDLPPEVRATYHTVLAELRDAAPPLDPDVIAAVVHDEFGAPVEDVFASWERHPMASASIGQVHRATLPDDTPVAVKIQYPGVAEAVEADLANAESFAPLSRVFSPNLKIKPLMEELRLRVLDELDYQREAQYQQAFFERYDGHPFIRVPRVHADWCRPRVLTADLAVGATFDRMLEVAGEDEQQRYAEIIYRFVFGSIHRFRLFNADPHPGNYLFPGDGTVVFLDFGSVKPFSSRTREEMLGLLDAVLAGDADRLVDAMRGAGFILAGHHVDPGRVLEWYRIFHEPILEDREFTYTPEFAREVIRTTSDPRGGYLDMLRKLNLPPDYLLLNRIQWGVNSILGRLRATANWHRINLELWGKAPPATPLGEEEEAFVTESPHRA
jgi:predicted unusual protein kinase regulating ubiquinone biosynthesis (AarF/ABC1/UbiB family)